MARTAEYLAYLESPEWAEKRRLVFERDEHRCVVCNGGDHLDVHHRTYCRFGSEHLSDLTTLCRFCHDAFHKGGRLRGVA